MKGIHAEQQYYEHTKFISKNIPIKFHKKATKAHKYINVLKFP